jgi:hypothetical protein
VLQKTHRPAGLALLSDLIELAIGCGATARRGDWRSVLDRARDDLAEGYRGLVLDTVGRAACDHDRDHDQRDHARDAERDQEHRQPFVHAVHLPEIW